MNNYRDDSEEELATRVAVSAFSNITDSIIDTHSAVKVLAITVTLEICGLAMLYVAKDKVTNALAESDGEIWIYVSAAVFVVGFLSSFAIYRLVAKKWPHTGSRLMIWLVSVGVGLLNVLLFFALITFEMR